MPKSARKTARKHHYVPEMYLDGFVGRKGQCFVVDAERRRPFKSKPAGIAAQRDFNLIEAPGVPPDALEKELANLEGVIAPGIKRIRETASFGEDSKDREDVINLITLLAARNPRMRQDMQKFYTEIFRAMLAAAFEDKAKWEAVVQAIKAAGIWPENEPSDFEGYKKFVEDNIDKVKAHQNFSLEMELESMERLYWYFDARKWRIVKAKEGSGGFVTTDHPVCIRHPGGVNYGAQYAPGLALSDRDVLFPRSSNLALIGRMEGDEDVIELDEKGVADFNATVMGYAMTQIYAADDQYRYTRPPGKALGKGCTLLQDSNLKVREE
jgi:Protein of unknown function (DUF4238)